MRKEKNDQSLLLMMKNTQNKLQGVSYLQPLYRSIKKVQDGNKNDTLLLLSILSIQLISFPYTKNTYLYFWAGPQSLSQL